MIIVVKGGHVQHSLCSRV